MDPHRFLVNLAMVLCVAAATTVACRRARLPVIFGYLAAGMIVGPHVPVPLVADVEIVRALAELGVILLMFSIGLEFSLGKIARVGLPALVTAVVQSGLVAWLSYLAARALGWRPLECVFAGAAMAISSTTIIAKVFEERRVGGRLRDLVLGILVVEDLIAILLLTTLTAVGAGRDLSGRELAATTARLGGFLAVVYIVGLPTVPRFIRAIVRHGSAETTIVSSVGLCFALAVLADAAGHSVALGAFLAGSLIAESGEEHEVGRLTVPVRDVFAAIFFVAVGMLIDPSLVAAHAGAVAALTSVVVVGKIAGVSVGAFLTGAGLRTSLQAGMSLAQIGEFSFIIAGVGLSTGATRDFLYPVAIAVSAVTTLLTPWLIRASDPAAAWIDRRLPRPVQTFVALYGSWLEGLRSTPGSNGEPRSRRLAGLLFLDAAIVAAIAIGTSLGLVEAEAFLARAAGLAPPAARVAVLVVALAVSTPFLFGIVGIARLIGLAAARTAFPDKKADEVDTAAAPRAAMTVGVQAACVASVSVPLVAVTQPFLPPVAGALLGVAYVVVLGLAFRRSAAELEGHVRAGAQVIAAALGKAARPRPGETPTGQSMLDEARRLLPGIGGPAAVRLDPGTAAVGRTLVELNLRGLTGATVLAIAKSSGAVVQPTGRERLEAGDILAVAGPVEAIEAARALLAGEGG